MYTFPNSVPSGINIIPQTSGTQALGSEAKPFGTINGNATRSISWNEIPAGVMNGANTTFTLGNAPYDAWSIQLYVNGTYNSPSGIGAPYFDFYLSGSTINMNIAPASGSIMIANYQY